MGKVVTFPINAWRVTHPGKWRSPWHYGGEDAISSARDVLEALRKDGLRDRRMEALEAALAALLTPTGQASVIPLRPHQLDLFHDHWPWGPSFAPWDGDPKQRHLRFKRGKD